MARDAATIQAEIDALRAKMAGGVQRTRHGDTETSFFGPGDLQKVLDALLAELAAAQAYPVRQVRFRTSKGLD